MNKILEAADEIGNLFGQRFSWLDAKRSDVVKVLKKLVTDQQMINDKIIYLLSKIDSYIEADFDGRISKNSWIATEVKDVLSKLAPSSKYENEMSAKLLEEAAELLRNTDDGKINEVYAIINGVASKIRNQP